MDDGSIVAVGKIPGWDDRLTWMVSMLAHASVAVDRDGGGHGSLTDEGLHYRVVDGEYIARHAEALNNWAHSGEVQRWVSSMVGVDVSLSSHQKSAININVLTPGNRYELHRDEQSYSVLVFPVSYDYAPLVLHMEDLSRVRIRPVAGIAVVFDGATVAHEVERVPDGCDARISIPMVFTPGGVQRDPGADGYLYA